MVCVFSLSSASFNSLYFNLNGMKERWRLPTCKRGWQGADGKYRGWLSEREPPSSANLEFSLCLITNHHPDSARAKDEKSWTPPSAILICTLFSLFPFSVALPLFPATALGAASWPLKRQTCNLIINNLLNFSKRKQSWEMSASCLWVGWPFAGAGMAGKARRLT